MTKSSGQPGSGPGGYERFEAMLEGAEALGSDISEIANDLGSASRQALEASYSGAPDADLKIFWPLKQDANISQLLEARAKQRFRNFGLPALSGAEGEVKIGDTKVVDSFMSDKHYNHVLEEAYGSGSPRKDFIKDLIRWAEEMGQRDWSTLVRVDLNERHRVTVSLYEDQEPAREYLQARTDGTGISEEEFAGGHRPDVWVSDRVLVGGDQELAVSFTE